MGEILLAGLEMALGLAAFAEVGDLELAFAGLAFRGFWFRNFAFSHAGSSPLGILL